MIYDTIVVGGGPAGMTAAIYLLRANKKILVIEKNTFGGQIVNTSKVENYPGFKEISGMDLADNMYGQATNLGMISIYDEVTNINKTDSLFEIVTKKQTYVTKSVIVATGCSNRMLDIDNAKKYLGSGLTYCATCDGAFFKGQDVCVVGGGNTAIDDALYLANICHKVYLVHRRDEFRAEATKLELVKNKENIELLTNYIISNLAGENSLESVQLTSTIDNKNKNINVTGLFVAIGQTPNSNFLDNLIDNNGFIIANNCETNIPGLFIAGDVREKNVRQLTTAVADGTIAAMNTCEYLSNI